MAIQIPMTEVQGSSNIQAIGYKADQRVLRVTFLRGGSYDYLDVPPELHASFMKSPSYGIFFAQTIKGKFPCVPCPEPAVPKEKAAGVE